MFDIIGDIHGHAFELCLLLNKMGYNFDGKSFKHKENRKVLFVGDYIDRGPYSYQVFEMVKAMVDAGQAIALMGNHEFNAVCYHTKSETQKGYLRAHNLKNLHQHKATLENIQLVAKKTGRNPDQLLNNMISWFKALPYCFEDQKAST